MTQKTTAGEKSCSWAEGLYRSLPEIDEKKLKAMCVDKIEKTIRAKPEGDSGCHYSWTILFYAGIQGYSALEHVIERIET